ncbi:lysophospholipid acyltransferase family protein [Nocardioides piscis]|uniref:Glycerol acyltransferase n=1 Tax=Nocardioides piscis TaxID=2714938 RepID=A0A6G7YCJ0_9ACTN|nr:lysophospholipid acyltransferase family protein [Nocardioides piscis]QIK74513.1 glycerol acyltransferase [Nocardioides piscis]
MSDAEIIPIGTSGRPGRGSGRERPSAAARGLAGGPTPSSSPRARGAKAPTAKASPVKAPVVKRPAAKTTVAKKPTAKKTSAKQSPPTAQPPSVDQSQAASFASARPAATTQERHPLGGVPVADLLSAFQTAAVEVFGEQWERRLAEMLAFMRRRLSGEYVVDEYGFDTELTQRFLMAALRPIAQKWFRVEVRGAENIPATGGALVVSNHSGTIPVDGLMSMVSIHDETGRFLRPLGADLVFKMPVVSALARKSGATLACSEDAERMLSGGELVGVWPEGFKGIGKPFSERYKLQRFGRGGFVSAALRTGVPIIPLSVVGAEEIYPLVGNIPSLARLLGMPYIPITPFFPLLGPLGLVPLPSKWLLEFGEPIRTDAYDAHEAEDPMLVFDVTDQVRETIQQTLFSLLRERDSVFG